MKVEKKCIIIFLIAGIIIGYLSFLVGNNYLAAILAIIVLIVIEEILRRAFKIEEKFGWFMSNGGWIYIFIWFIVWIIFYNL
jgi:hypothetical protein